MRVEVKAIELWDGGRHRMVFEGKSECEGEMEWFWGWD